MDWGGPEFVLAIIALVTFGKLGRHAIYAKQGLVYDRKNRSNRDAAPAVDPAEVARQNQVNEQLRTDFKQLEQRTRVLERIVTDGGYNVAAQIEALRDDRRDEQRLDRHEGSGVPLGLNDSQTNRERV